MGATGLARKRALIRGAIAALIRRAAFALATAGWLCDAACPAEEPTLFQGPSAVAASRDGRTLHVACAESRQVARIDLPNHKITRRTMPGSPTGLVLSPDGSRLVVACAAPRSAIVVLNAVSGEQIAAIPAGHTAMGPAISPDGGRLYVCNRFSNDVSIIDLESCREVARVAVAREPIAAAVTPDGGAVLVANHLPNTRTDPAFLGVVSPVVTVIDARTLATSAIALHDGASCVRGLCLAPDGRHAFVTHLISNVLWDPFRVDGGWINLNVVSVLDVRQRKLVRMVGLDENERGAGNPWDVVYGGDGRTLCVSLSGTHELCLIAGSQLLRESAAIMSPAIGLWPVYPRLERSPWRRIRLPGQGPRGLSAAGSKIFIAQHFSDDVAVVDLCAAEESSPAAVPLGPTPRLTERRRGELLFHDATLCFQQWQSCASCHPDGRADAVNWDLANDGHGNPKNTKSMLWAHRTAPAMWEGVRVSAEVAVRSGLSHVLLAGASEADAVAIDVYLKSLAPTPSPHLVDGRRSPAAERGERLFHSELVGCDRCHPPPLYTDLRSHGFAARESPPSAPQCDTPTLVEVWRTAPYMHDGRYATITELLAEGRHGLPASGDISRRDIDDLAEFVLSL